MFGIITFIIGMTGMIASLLWLCIDKQKKHISKINGFGYEALFKISFFILTLYAGITFIYMETPMEYNIVTPIVSLERDTGIQGHFILGTGMVNSRPVYYAYTKQPDGGYILKSFSNVALYEINGEAPRVIQKSVCTKVNPLNWEMTRCEVTKKIIVPVGTIQQTFKG